MLTYFCKIRNYTTGNSSAGLNKNVNLVEDDEVDEVLAPQEEETDSEERFGTVFDTTPHDTCKHPKCRQIRNTG